MATNQGVVGSNPASRTNTIKGLQIYVCNPLFIVQALLNMGQVRANREKALFNHARECGLTAATNPCNGIKGDKETGRRDTYVEDDMYGRTD